MRIKKYDSANLRAFINSFSKNMQESNGKLIRDLAAYAPEYIVMKTPWGISMVDLETVFFVIQSSGDIRFLASYRLSIPRKGWAVLDFVLVEERQKLARRSWQGVHHA